MEDNLELWKKVEKTDPKHTKAYKGKGGFAGTAICAQSQIYKATELWGPIGGDWGPENESFVQLLEGKESVLIYQATLKHPTGSFPISSSIDFYNGKGYKDNDIVKKVTTDALTKGLSKLGFSADVFMGKFDDNKYVSEMRREFNSEPKNKETKSGGVTESNSPVIDTMLSVISMITDKDTGHKWRKDNQAAIDKLGSDKGKVMTAYLNKMKEFNKE